MKDKKEIRKIYLSIEEEFNNELVVLDSYKEISTRIKEKEELLKTCPIYKEIKVSQLGGEE